MVIEIDLMAEEEDFIVVSRKSEEAPEEIEDVQELEHLYMGEQLYLQTVFGL